MESQPEKTAAEWASAGLRRPTAQMAALAGAVLHWAVGPKAARQRRRVLPEPVKRLRQSARNRPRSRRSRPFVSANREPGLPQFRARPQSLGGPWRLRRGASPASSGPDRAANQACRRRQSPGQAQAAHQRANSAYLPPRAGGLLAAILRRSVQPPARSPRPAAPCARRMALQLVCCAATPASRPLAAASDSGGAFVVGVTGATGSPPAGDANGRPSGARDSGAASSTGGRGGSSTCGRVNPASQSGISVCGEEGAARGDVSPGTSGRISGTPLRAARRL